MSKEEFLTVEEAAVRLKLSVFTLKDYLRAGKVKGIKIGRHWRIPESVFTEMGVSATKLGPLRLASDPEPDTKKQGE